MLELRSKKDDTAVVKVLTSSDYFRNCNLLHFLFLFNRKNFFFIVLLTFDRRLSQRHKSTINFQTHFDMNLNGIFINRKVERKKRLQDGPRGAEDEAPAHSQPRQLSGLARESLAKILNATRWKGRPANAGRMRT